MDNPAPITSTPSNFVLPTTLTPSVPLATQPPAGDGGSSVVNAPGVNPKKNPKGKLVLTILGVLLLIAGVGAGVVLVQRQQQFASKAWDCTKYNFLVSESGVVSVRNDSTRTEPAQQAKVLIDSVEVAILDVPNLTAGQTAVLGTVQVPTGGFTWQIIGTVDCSDSGKYELSTPTTTPGVTATPTATPGGTCKPRPACLDAQPPCEMPEPVDDWCATPTPTATPTPPPVGASCSKIQAYSVANNNPTVASNWNALSSLELSKLEVGDVVYFTVYGSGLGTTFDKARFRVNPGNSSSLSWVESTIKKPGSEEYYYKYTIPSGATTISTDAQVHTEAGDWI